MSQLAENILKVASAEQTRARRAALASRLGSGLVLLPSASVPKRNMASFPADFRQSSHLLYFTGLSSPGITAIFDLDNGRFHLFAPELSADDLVWHDREPSRRELAEAAGADQAHPVTALKAFVEKQMQQGRRIYVAHNGDWPGMTASNELIDAITALRLRKDESEIAAMRSAMTVTSRAHRLAMAVTRPGINERAIQAMVEAVFRAAGCAPSYGPIATGRGEVLHACKPHRVLEDGQLFLLDAGCEHENSYSTDVTRTWPVSGRFNDAQARFYDITLAAQAKALARCEAGSPYRDVHAAAAREIIEGLKDYGLLRGNTDDLYIREAHALFFPHGVGHLIGLDVHDMEDLGEDRVGYGDGFLRESDKLGRRYLRLSRVLQPGMVVTVEPGIYFIPAYLEDSELQGRYRDCVDFEKALQLRSFGGIRIEDDVLITEDGPDILSAAIPKERAELEAIIGSAPEVLDSFTKF